MIPSLNIERIYHNGTSFSIVDNSCDNNVIPNKIVFSIGFFKKDKIDIQLDDNTQLTPYQFMNGSSFMINSNILGITKQEDNFLEIESGIIEIQYYCFFDTFIEAEVNRNFVVLNVPHYTISANYDYLLINNKVYSILKAQCYGNVIRLGENTEKISSFHLYGGCLGINYVIHTNQIKNKLISLIGDNVINITQKQSSCSKVEQELRDKIIDNLMLWNSIKILKHRNKLFDLNFVIDTLKNNLFNIPIDVSLINTERHGSTCNICN